MRLFTLLAILLQSSDAFVPLKCFHNGAAVATARKQTLLELVDPTVAAVLADILGDLTVVDVTTTMAATFLGTVSQVPRIINLQAELNKSKKELEEEKAMMSARIAQLEDEVLKTDENVEDRTDQFKQGYDEQVKKQLEIAVQKIKSDFQNSMKIRMDELKVVLEGEVKKENETRLLTGTLDAVNAITGSAQEELVELQLQNIQMQRLNEQLEAAVESANASAEPKKRFALF